MACRLGWGEQPNFKLSMEIGKKKELGDCENGKDSFGHQNGWSGFFN